MDIPHVTFELADFPRSMLGVEAVKEFKVISTNTGAEYGEESGGVISLFFKSGTNALHGSAYEYYRNSAFDARNFFDRPPRFLLCTAISLALRWEVPSRRTTRSSLSITKVSGWPPQTHFCPICPMQRPEVPEMDSAWCPMLPVG